MILPQIALANKLALFSGLSELDPVANSLGARSPRLGGPCYADTLLEIANQ